MYKSTYLIVRDGEVVYRTVVMGDHPAQTFRDENRHLFEPGDELFVKLGSTFWQYESIEQDNEQC